jgi:hypothetical protein
MAFPKSELASDQKNFTLKFTTATLAGTVEKYHPEGRDSSMLPGRCFQTSMDISAGASGGPVAFGDGSVFGINSTGWDGVPVGFISSVEDLFELEVRRIRLPDGQIRERAGPRTRGSWSDSRHIASVKLPQTVVDTCPGIRHRNELDSQSSGRLAHHPQTSIKLTYHRSLRYIARNGEIPLPLLLCMPIISMDQI